MMIKCTNLFIALLLLLATPSFNGPTLQTSSRGKGIGNRAVETGNVDLSLQLERTLET